MSRFAAFGLALCLAAGCHDDDPDLPLSSGGGGGLPGSGLLSSGFGTGGALGDNPSASDDRAFAVAADATYAVVVGSDNSPGFPAWRIEKRLLTTGDLDPSFGVEGVVISSPSAANAQPLAIAIDATSMYVGGFDSVPGNPQWRLEKRSLATGALDWTVQENPSGATDRILAIAVDSTSVYAVGEDSSPGNLQWRIEKRDKATGALDLSFDTDGIAVSNPNAAGTDQAFAVALDAAALYVAGFDSVVGVRQWRIEKRDRTTGAIDWVVQEDPTPGAPDEIRAAVVVGGALFVGGFDAGARIEKRDTATGALDATFDGDGILTGGAGDRVFGLAADGGSIFAVGRDLAAGNAEWRIERFNGTTGAAEFAAVQTNPSTGADEANAVAIAGTSMIVVGFDTAAGNVGWRIEKRALADGSADAVFGTGFVTSNPSAGADEIYAIAIDAAAIFLAGRDNATGNDQWRIERRNLATGALDWAVQEDPTGGSDQPRAIAQDATSIYVVGMDSTNGNQWRIEKRDKATGALDLAFDADGIVTSDPSVGDDRALAIAVDAASIYVGGYDSAAGDTQWRIEKRNRTTGALDAGFDGDGILQLNPSGGGDAIQGMTVDATSLYLVGGDSAAGGGEWRIEKRSAGTGALDFAITEDFGAGSDLANAVAVDGSSIYVVGRDFTPGNFQWRIEKRSLATGALDFAVTVNPGAGVDEPSSLAIDGTSMYVAGYQTNPAGIGWRLEKRSLSTGALDTTFHANGIVLVDPGSGTDAAAGVRVDASFVYSAGYDARTGNSGWRVEKRVK